jgi:uncharacterized protein (DUF849 family)
MWIKACLNGARRPAENPAIPITPDAIAAEAVAAAAAGARAVHFHPKDADGVDTLDAAAVAAAVRAVRAAAPDLALGVTTGAWALPDAAQRVAAVQAWTVLPDFASVNWSEDGSDAVAAVLANRGVGIEAGLFHPQAVANWAASPWRGSCIRMMIELRWTPDFESRVDEMLGQVRAVDPTTPVLVHSFGEGVWPAIRYAASLGLQSRVGFEDTVALPDGTPAPGNAALVAAAYEIASSAV